MRMNSVYKISRMWESKRLNYMNALLNAAHDAKHFWEYD